MSDRGVQFFALPNEFRDWLASLQSELGLTFLVQEENPTPNWIDSRALTLAMNAQWGRFYITDQNLDYPLVSPDINPNRWGLITCDRPRIVEGTLELAEMSSKSDWADEDDHLHENVKGHELLGKLRRRLRKLTTKRVCIRDLDDLTDEGSLVRDIRCTEGAAVWASNGGTLQQKKGFASEFVIEQPRDTPTSSPASQS